MLSFLLQHLSSRWAARLSSCLSSLYLQIVHGLVLHFCLLKSYGTQCLAYTIGIFFFVYMCVDFFDHESSYHLPSAKLVLDIVLGVLHTLSLNFTTTWKIRSCDPLNHVSWGLLILELRKGWLKATRDDPRTFQSLPKISGNSPSA